MNKLSKDLQDRINALAAEIDVKPGYLIYMASGVAHNIIKDGLWDHFIKEAPENQNDMIMAYIDNQIKINDKIKTIYATNPEAKKLFIEKIYMMLRGEPWLKKKK